MKISYCLFFINLSSIKVFSTEIECFSNDDEFLRQNHTSVEYLKTSFYPWLPKTFPKCWFYLKQYFCTQSETDLMPSVPMKINVCRELNEFCGMLKKDKTWKENIECKIDLLVSSAVYRNLSNSDYPICSGYLIYSQSLQSYHQWVVKWETHGFDGKKTMHTCSLPCQSKLNLYQASDHDIKIPILTQGVISLLICLFTIMTFLIDWKNQNRYPAVILFILSCCYFFCLFGWIMQYFSLGEKISCNEASQVRRVGEPKSVDSVVCMVSFVLIYFSMVSISVWFVMLMYSWNISFKSLATKDDSVQGKVKYFHLIAWLLAGVCTKICTFTEQVDSHNVVDICFTGYSSKVVRYIFVMAPTLICLCFGEILLISCVRCLTKLKTACGVFLIQKATQNISRTIKRLVIYGVVLFLTSVISIVCLFNQDISINERNLAYSDYVICEIVELYKAEHMRRPCIKPRDYKLFCLHIQFSCLCVSSIATSSWTWTYATLKIWKKVWMRHFGKRQKPNENVRWYLRINKKKISPFILPINPNDPLNPRFPVTFTPAMVQCHNVGKRNSLQDFICDFNKKVSSSCRRNSSENQRRRSCDDIRSVMDLFSARRGTKISLESVYSAEPSIFLPPLGQKCKPRSKSLSSLQSFGHLSANRMNCLRRISSNLTVIPLDESRDVESRDIKDCKKSMLSLLNSQRSQLYTPLSSVHKNNIVADCIPYSTMYRRPSK